MKVTKIVTALSLSLAALTSSYASGVPAKPGEITYAEKTAMCAVVTEWAGTLPDNHNAHVYKTLSVKFREFTKDEVKSGRGTQKEVDKAYSYMGMQMEYLKTGKDADLRKVILLDNGIAAKDCFLEAQRLMFIQ
jgi:hypothetical protein